MNEFARRQTLAIKIYCEVCGELIVNLTNSDNKKFIEYECPNCEEVYKEKIEGVLPNE